MGETAAPLPVRPLEALLCPCPAGLAADGVPSAGDAASCTTGVTLPVEGGLTRR